jgi:uncharacterized SAM-binding protein YcdF (DUF218 family)
MFNPVVCPDSTASNWAGLSWKIAGWLSQWLAQPFLVMLVLAALIWSVRFVPRHRVRRPLRVALSAVFLLYLSAIFPPAVNLAEGVLTSQIPPYQGESADAVVVLGRGKELNPSRVQVAAELWEDDKAPLIFASGIYDAPEIVNMLHEKGIPDQATEGEDCSRTTYENAKFTAKILKPQGIERILLVTDAPHLLRSLLTFQSFGFAVVPISSSSLKELNNETRTTMVLREYVGLVGYELMGRFSSPAISSERTVETAQNLVGSTS